MPVFFGRMGKIRKMCSCDSECLQDMKRFCVVVVQGTLRVHLASILVLKEKYFSLQSALFLSLSPLLPP